MKKVILLCAAVLFMISTQAQIKQSNSAKYAFAYSGEMHKKNSLSLMSLKKSLEDEPAGSTADDHEFLIGFRFMPTISSFDVNEVDNSTIETTAIVSYGWGGLIGATLSENVALQAEVIYSTYAQKFKEGQNETTLKLNYINIPLMLVLNTDYTKPVNFNIAAGPQIGLNTGSKIEAGADGNGTDTVHAVLAVKPADIGLAYGAGFDFGFGESLSTRLCIGFRGVFGLVDISDDSNNLETNEYYVLDKAHVKTYSLYFGLTFAL
jgi:hypothetical protein